MNIKIFDRATKYIDKMLYSRREDWCIKRLYIRPNLYLQIEVERVTLDDIESGTYDGWERGTPVYMQLFITDKNGKELDGCTVQYCFEREYRNDLDYLLGMYV